MVFLVEGSKEQVVSVVWQLLTGDAQKKAKQGGCGAFWAACRVVMQRHHEMNGSKDLKWVNLRA